MLMSRHIVPVAAPVLSTALLLGACGGGGSTPVAPTPPVTTPPPAPTPTPVPPTYAFTLSGRVVSSTAGVPVPGASLTFDAFAPVESAADGSFQFASETNPEFTPFSVSASAPGHVDRVMWLNWATERKDIQIDLLPLTPPFSLDFYRQLVRNAYDDPATLRTLTRWTRSPSVYIRTVDANGRDVDPATIAAVASTLQKAVPALSGNTLRVVAVETGPENPRRSGWITVEFIEDPMSNMCGRAWVGSDPGRIELNLNRCGGCPGTRIRPATVAHEVGHVLGFWHVEGREHLMDPWEDRPCTQDGPSALEELHAAIAYKRAPGNMDPDVDPKSGAAATPPAFGPTMISCIAKTE